MANTKNEHSEGQMVFEGHVEEGVRSYCIIYDLDEPPMELCFSTNLSVDEVSLRLLAFIKELRRTRFNMPNKGFRLKPTEEEGLYELVDNTVPKNPRHAA